MHRCVSENPVGTNELRANSVSEFRETSSEHYYLESLNLDLARRYVEVFGHDDIRNVSVTIEIERLGAKGRASSTITAILAERLDDVQIDLHEACGLRS